jgi:hypothetical protein
VGWLNADGYTTSYSSCMSNTGLPPSLVDDGVAVNLKTGNGQEVAQYTNASTAQEGYQQAEETTGPAVISIVRHEVFVIETTNSDQLGKYTTTNTPDCLLGI